MATRGDITACRFKKLCSSAFGMATSGLCPCARFGRSQTGLGCSKRPHATPHSWRWRALAVWTGFLNSTESRFSRLCTDVGTPLDELQHFSCHPEMKERLSKSRWPRDAARGWGHLETSGFEGAGLRMLEAGTTFDGDRVRGQIVQLMASAMRCLSEMGMGADVNASDALEPW